MNNYKCDICEYETKRQDNYNRHIKTKKHLEKVNTDTDNKYLTDIKTIPNSDDNSMTPSGLAATRSDSRNYSCEYCGKSITRANNINRHLKSCDKKREHDEQIQQNYKKTINDMKLKEQIKILNLKLSQAETNAIKYEEDAKYYKKMFLEAGNLVKKSVSSLTYVVENYNDAPSLQMLTLDDINNANDENTEKEIVDDIISAYKHKTLGQYLGDYIIKIYKKADPKSQSIWNTDDTRLTYLIKELSHNTSSNWMVDKKGLKTTSYIIKPLLDYVKTILTDHQINFNIPRGKCNSVEMEFILENSRRLLDIINDIDDGNVSKDILKHISSQLRFDTKCIK